MAMIDEQENPEDVDTNSDDDDIDSPQDVSDNYNSTNSTDLEIET